MANILIVDDDANLGLALEMSLGQAGHHCRVADTATAGWEELQRSQPDLALLDLQLPDMSGIDLLGRIQEHKLDFPVIIMTAFGTVTTATTAMKQGATDFIEKPLSVKEMCQLVVRLLKSRELARKIDAAGTAETDDDDQTLIAASPQMREVLGLADRIAGLPSRSGIGLTATLLLGETGTGKEMIARYIHRHGGPADRPFIHVNCTAIPETLFEAEHFGHERGVFTDAKFTRAGLFEAANGGTIFLDEVGDMPPAMQSKLLVAIETGRYRRLGATTEQVFDARIIAATNSDLERRLADGGFRTDLYHRLRMFQIVLPPLRERPEDLNAMTEHFLARFCRQLHRGVPRISTAAREAMTAYDWPGNVRELAHMLLRTLVATDADELQPTHLGLAGGSAKQPAEADDRRESIRLDFSSGSVSLSDVERQLIQAALDHAGGNITEAAKLVGMPRGTFRYRLERLGLA